MQYSTIVTFQEFTCPHCLEGFIEELPAAERSGAAGSTAAEQDFEQPSNLFDNPQISNEASITLIVRSGKLVS